MIEYKAQNGFLKSKNEGSSAGQWEAQLRKGCLEMAILASLTQGRRYGLEILRSLDGTASLALAEGTLYLILNRLKGDGLVESEWIDAGTGHPRKYYWLTQAGHERIRMMAKFWAKFSADLNALLDPARSSMKEDIRDDK